MTHSTNGSVQYEAGDAPDPNDPSDANGSSLLSRLLMPVLLMAVALFVLRRLNKGNVV